jgi:CTP synthase (UTP-ammonia lyase)
LIISKLTCSLVGTTQTITLLPGTLAHRMYGKGEATEHFVCNYGLNPAYREILSQGGLTIAGIDASEEVRIVELSAHRFFLATLFLPQMSSTLIRPHSLIVAYLQAAQNFKHANTGTRARGDPASVKAGHCAGM